MNWNVLSTGVKHERDYDNINCNTCQKKILQYFVGYLDTLPLSLSYSVIPDSLQHHELYSPSGSPVMDFSGKNTGVGSHFLLQGSFLTQGSNLGLLHCRQIFFLPSQPPGYKLNWIKCSSLLHLYSNCFWWLARNARPPCVRHQLLEARFCFYHVFINEFYATHLPKIWPIYLCSVKETFLSSYHGLRLDAQ